MSFFDERDGSTETNLSPDLVSYYRQVLQTHTGRDGACQVCRIPRCPHWLDAYDRLAAAGHTMAEPGAWEPFMQGPRR